MLGVHAFARPNSVKVPIALEEMGRSKGAKWGVAINVAALLLFALSMPPRIR